MYKNTHQFLENESFDDVEPRVNNENSVKMNAVEDSQINMELFPNISSHEKPQSIINTHILSFKMNEEDKIDLKENPIEMIFPHLSTEYSKNPTCLYWSYDKLYFFSSNLNKL